MMVIFLSLALIPSIYSSASADGTLYESLFGPLAPLEKDEVVSVDSSIGDDELSTVIESVITALPGEISKIKQSQAQINESLRTFGDWGPYFASLVGGQSSQRHFLTQQFHELTNGLFAVKSLPENQLENFRKYTSSLSDMLAYKHDASEAAHSSGDPASIAAVTAIGELLEDKKQPGDAERALAAVTNAEVKGKLQSYLTAVKSVDVNKLKAFKKYVEASRPVLRVNELEKRLEQAELLKAGMTEITEKEKEVKKNIEEKKDAEEIKTDLGEWVTDLRKEINNVKDGVLVNLKTAVLKKIETVAADLMAILNASITPESVTGTSHTDPAVVAGTTQSPTASAGNKKRLVIGISLAAAAVVLGGGAVFLYFKNTKA